eukprot:1150319-Pelagomonas_calceolata.AAC.5
MACRAFHVWQPKFGKPKLGSRKRKFYTSQKDACNKERFPDEIASKGLYREGITLSGGEQEKESPGVQEHGGETSRSPLALFMAFFLG